MSYSQVIVSTIGAEAKDSALLLVDLKRDTYRTLLPYYGPIHVTPDALYVVHSRQHRAVLEKFDRDGLAWSRRLNDCLDTHSVVEVNGRLAVCSTGTNEVLWLDGAGVEQNRWSPDPMHEPDSWHINSLAAHEGRLFTTCFGRFPRFRGWAGKVDGAGMLLDVDSKRAVLEGLSAPHDPRRLEGAWLLNNASKGQTLRIPDGQAPQVVAAGPGFSRGLAVLDDVYAIGFSTPRHGPDRGCARVAVVDRARPRILKTISIPHPEIGHIYAAPADNVLAAVFREGERGRPVSLPYSAIAKADRAGTLEVVGPPRPLGEGVFEFTVRLTNAGAAVWASGADVPLQLAYQIFDARGDILLPEGARTPLPLELLPGRTLTFNVSIDLALCRHMPLATALHLTLVQDGVAWWEANERWTPARVALPRPSRREHSAVRVRENVAFV